MDVIAVSLYSENTAITDRLDKKGVRIEYLDKKPGFDASVIIKLVHLFKKEKPDVVHTHIYASKYALPAAAIAGVKKRYIQSIVWLRRSRVLWERKSTLSCIDTVA